ASIVSSMSAVFQCQWVMTHSTPFYPKCIKE
ncbi:hypothetical protein DBR06_SOUSAS2510032, partial [Sousa chinensis]